MTRSHPPTLLTLVKRALLEECGVTKGAHVLLALSGGGDSTALLHALALLSKQLDFRVSAHGVDHGLRAEASAELDAAEAQCAALAVAFSRTKLQLNDGGNLQARARAARRAALLEAAELCAANRIATAHHADDRAETVLIRLLRGSGPRGLSVLAPQDGIWIRPLCRARKSDVRAHLARHALRFAEDPSNANRRFLRARVRFELLPLLAELSPQIVVHLCALADALGETTKFDGTKAELGVALELNRAQRELVGRALAFRQHSARVSLPSGRELSFDPATFEPLLVAARPRLRKR
ncbi:MAG TPA: tRNA lysidine(34) synthetase TilS [Polyangiaceae bacterium]|jgi:tRNA(Ile)-lysidine synthase|nr:tRNA lysidine(34) synthetase TilS [Polyangiaceae bacterium]